MSVNCVITLLLLNSAFLVNLHYLFTIQFRYVSQNAQEKRISSYRTITRKFFFILEQLRDPKLKKTVTLFAVI